MLCPMFLLAVLESMPRAHVLMAGSVSVVCVFISDFLAIIWIFGAFMRAPEGGIMSNH